MGLVVLALLLVVCYWLYSSIRRFYGYFKELGIPYVPVTLQVREMATQLFRRKHVLYSMRDTYDIFPDAKYFGFFNFTKPLLIIRDLDLIKTITIKNFDNFPDHQTLVDVSIDPLFGGNLFSMHGDQWRETRNLLTPAFTSSKMKGMFDLMVQVANTFTDYIVDLAKDPNNMLATKDLFCRYTNDVIASCAFGISVDSLRDPKNEFYMMGREATDFEGSLSNKFFLARSFPQLMKFFKIKIVPNNVKRFFTNIVEMTIRTRDEKGITRPDMIQLMMDARGKTSENLKLDLIEMTAQAFIFFFGGFDTTSTQMCIIAHELTINPDIQRKLQEEIDEVLLQTNGKPTYEAINSMVYLDAVFNETMRRHPQGTLLDRVCKKAFEFPPALPGGKPVTIPAGMHVWIPVAAIHLHEQFYDNPLKFDPDRYLHKKVSINDVENLGFGIGPRSCIGNRFAMQEIKILFFHLLSRLTFKPNSKTCDPFEYNPSSLSIIAKGGYWLSVEPRDKKL